MVSGEKWRREKLFAKQLPGYINENYEQRRSFLDPDRSDTERFGPVGYRSETGSDLFIV
jgi:hypothetical protein